MVSTPQIKERQLKLFSQREDKISSHTDRIFCTLLAFQWIAGIAVAVFFSPKAWNGVTSSIQLNVWLAIVLGGTISGLPIFCALTFPGTAFARHTIAIGQALTSALFIHLTGGRIETHFHIFGSLALLALYRDPKVLFTATFVVIADHILRGMYWPQSIYGVLIPNQWRWIELFGWIVFENIFLLLAIRNNKKEMMEVAENQAHLEAYRQEMEVKVKERTSDFDASELRFRTLSSSSPVGIYQCNVEGYLIYSNQRCHEIAGLQGAEMPADEWANHLHEEDFESVAQEWKDCMASGKDFSREFKLLTPLGKIRWVHSRANLLRNDKAEVTGCVGTLEDITEQKTVATELEKARDDAEKASQIKSEFVATMSHEIRTPMNGVLGMLGLLLDTELTDEQRDLAKTARMSADSLLDILNEILDFSKIEAGKLVLEPIPFDLLALIEEVTDLFKVRLAEKGLDLIVRYAPSAPRLFVGDPGRIRQVLVNLTSNAMKFTEHGHVLISVDCEEQRQDIVRMKIAVHDTGLGIPENRMNHIFDRFTQADASTTRKFGGTGLGLTICKRLVETMGGQIEVASEQERGSTFTITIPLPEVKDAHLPASLQPDIRNLRILVLDENQVSRDVLQELLTSWGMRNDATTDLPELIENLKSAARAGDPYEVAVVSLSDSEIGELTQNIKANPALWKTKLILLRSIKNHEYINSERESRFEACLTKPFRASQLMDVLSGIVQGRKQLAVIASQHTKSLLRSTKRQRFSARVLVVEDNIVNQKVAKHNLERLGCSVNVAGNGKEAVEILNLFPYDMVFMDCEMPVLDGFEATQEIRKNHPRKNIPIVAMTARAMRGDREKCLMAGMDAYLSKPVSPVDFESALLQWAPQTAIQDSDTYFEVSSILNIESDSINQHISGKLQDLAQIMDPPELASLIEEFLTSCRQYISGMKNACSQLRPDYLRMHAHSMKGSSLYIGANRVADLCMQLEKSGMNKEMEVSKELITKLEQEFEKLKGYLQQEKDSILKMPAV